MSTDESGSGEILLFGVRVVVDSMRKSVSVNNLSQYQQPQPQPQELIDKPIEAVPVACYASADEAAHRRPRDRKRGIPWTEEEHKMFLVGLQKVGKGGWRGISKNYVKTRNPTQVASHAQKYFLRRTNLNRRRRRSSLFDITTDTITAMPINYNVTEDNQDKVQPLLLPAPEMNNGFHLIALHKPMERLSITQSDDHNANIFLQARVGGLNLNLEPISSDTDPQTLSLGLSLSLDHSYSNQQARNSEYQAMPHFNNRDSFVTVA